MKKLLFLMLFLPAISFAAEDTGTKLSIEGTLFKKNGKWHLFVESDSAAIKKGVFALIKIPKAQAKTLHEKDYVAVLGHQEKCASPHICMSVEKIKLTVNDPLKNRK